MLYYGCAHTIRMASLIHCQNVWRWFDLVTAKLKPKWEEVKKKNAARWVPVAHEPRNPRGRMTLMSDVSQRIIKKQLLDMRATGMPINVFVMTPIIRGIIRTYQHTGGERREYEAI